MLLTGKRLGALLKTGSSTPLAESLVLVLVPPIVLVLVLVFDPISKEPGALSRPAEKGALSSATQTTTEVV